MLLAILDVRPAEGRERVEQVASQLLAATQQNAVHITVADSSTLDEHVSDKAFPAF